MLKVVSFAVGVALLAACSTPKPPETPVEAAPMPVEFADAKYTEIGKQGTAALSRGDIDGWMAMFADDAKYFWSGGDSVVGKPAITAYWKERRGNVIDSITFVNDIWLPVNVNDLQNATKGKWLLSWYGANVKYKNGAKVYAMIHTDLHFNDMDKIDLVIQYFDRVPLNAALAAKPAKK